MQSQNYKLTSEDIQILTDISACRFDIKNADIVLQMISYIKNVIKNNHSLALDKKFKNIYGLKCDIRDLPQYIEKSDQNASIVKKFEALMNRAFPKTFVEYHREIQEAIMENLDLMLKK